MKCFLVTAALFLALLSVPVQAAGSHNPVAVTFSLQADGPVAAHQSFWVAYGPLNGSFGLVPLRHRGGGAYSATRRLPAQGHTVFAFLTARTTVNTPFGPGPGSDAQTIGAVGPISAGRYGLRTIHWQVPIG